MPVQSPIRLEEMAVDPSAVVDTLRELRPPRLPAVDSVRERIRGLDVSETVQSALGAAGASIAAAGESIGAGGESVHGAIARRRNPRHSRRRWLIAGVVLVLVAVGVGSWLARRATERAAARDEARLDRTALDRGEGEGLGTAVGSSRAALRPAGPALGSSQVDAAAGVAAAGAATGRKVGGAREVRPRSG